MTAIKTEVTWSIGDGKETLIVRRDSLGNVVLAGLLELTDREDGYTDFESFTFVPSDYIPHLIEVLKQLHK